MSNIYIYVKIIPSNKNLTVCKTKVILKSIKIFVLL